MFCCYAFLQVKNTCTEAGMETLCRHRDSENEGCTAVKGNGNGFTQNVLQANCAKNTTWSSGCRSIDHLFYNSEMNASEGWESEAAFALKSYKNAKTSMTGK